MCKSATENSLRDNFQEFSKISIWSDRKGKIEFFQNEFLLLYDRKGIKKVISNNYISDNKLTTNINVKFTKMSESTMADIV